MNNQQAYNEWAKNYDLVENKTRDSEAKALQAMLSPYTFTNVLEIGCGTGKNTKWLYSKTKNLIGADFSVEMLAKARAKITDENISFLQLDVRENWNFMENSFDLVTFSLVLEHIENIDFVFSQANKVLKQNGLLYIGELHPFKQYSGSKARFDNNSKIFELECFTHNVSDFFNAGINNNFEVIELKEWFDDESDRQIPRLLTMLFKNKSSI